MERNLTLKEAIDALTAGDGWHRPSFPLECGNLMYAIICLFGISPDIAVTLKNSSGHTGNGPNFKYQYSYSFIFNHPIGHLWEEIKNALLKIPNAPSYRINECMYVGEREITFFGSR